MSDNRTVIGMEELGGSIDMLTQLVQRNIVRNATRAGARVYREGMKSRVARASGELAKAIAIKDYPKRTEGDYKALIGVKYSKKVAASSRTNTKRGKDAAPSSEDPAVYAQFLEFGRPGKTGHTHQAAQPFIRPTFDADTPKAEQAFADRAKQDLGKYLK